MKRSTERILVTHAGTLPRPADLTNMLAAKNEGKPYDYEAYGQRVRSAVAQGVRQQVDCGVDIVNDGELGKANFSRYTRERL
ncbi:MAG TPA: methionine synthase, partial [Candidatus Binatia bacterium]|nr:methionine synthase [Candidatus Binatia bacterium]